MKFVLVVIAPLCLLLVGPEQRLPQPKHVTAAALPILPAATLLPRPVPAITRALIISIDGLRPDVMLRADAPNLKSLYTTGSFSFWARTTPLSITLPSHTTMLTGAFTFH